MINIEISRSELEKVVQRACNKSVCNFIDDFGRLHFGVSNGLDCRTYSEDIINDMIPSKLVETIFDVSGYKAKSLLTKEHIKQIADVCKSISNSLVNEVIQKLENISIKE